MDNRRRLAGDRRRLLVGWRFVEVRAYRWPVVFFFKGIMSSPESGCRAFQRPDLGQPWLQSPPPPPPLNMVPLLSAFPGSVAWCPLCHGEWVPASWARPRPLPRVGVGHRQCLPSKSAGLLGISSPSPLPPRYAVQARHPPRATGLHPLKGT